MRGIGRAVCIDHIIRIAMIGSQENRIPILQGGGYYSLYAFINRFHGTDGRFPDTGMTYHICIGIIKTNKIRCPVFNFGNNGVRYFDGAHLGLQVISGNLWRWDHDSRFTFKGYLPAAAEEKCYMRVLLSFCNTDLL